MIIELESEHLNEMIKKLVSEANKSVRSVISKNDPYFVIIVKELGESEEMLNEVAFSNNFSKDINFPSISIKSSAQKRRRYNRFNDFTTPSKRNNLYIKNMNPINSFDNFRSRLNKTEERPAISERESLAVHLNITS